jgi:hypothetical protein
MDDVFRTVNSGECKYKLCDCLVFRRNTPIFSRLLILILFEGNYDDSYFDDSYYDVYFYLSFSQNT